MAVHAELSFASLFGREPDTVWAAPGRVNVIGEHTDYNDGFCLPIALPLVTVASVGRRTDSAVHVASVQMSSDGVVEIADVLPGKVDGWAAYVAGIVWALRDEGYGVGGFDVLVDSAVPVGSGLSSSAALECSVLGAVDELAELGIDRSRLARIAQHAENDFVGAPTGIMDQSASLLCAAGTALLLDCRSLATTQVAFDLVGAGLELLVIDTRAPHSHVESEYAERRRTCEEAARALGVPALRDLAEPEQPALDPVARKRVRHIVTENARTLQAVELLQAGDIRSTGPLLTASHVSLRDDYEVTVPRLDVAVDAALAAGAHGARMTGGGFGGCAVALIDADNRAGVEAAVRAAYERAGFGGPGFLPVTPSAGAHRL